MGKLTDKDIRDLQVPEGAKDIQAFDDELPGFGVRKFASGKTSLFVKYTVGKQQRRKTLGPWIAGTLPTIRKEAAVVLAQARLGMWWVRPGRHRVKDTRFWEPLVNKAIHPDPVEISSLTAATEYHSPPSDDLVPEHLERSKVRRHGVVVEVAADDGPQPFALFGNRVMHTLPHLLFDHPQL